MINFMELWQHGAILQTYLREKYSILCRRLREILKMEEYFPFTSSALFRKLYTDKVVEYERERKRKLTESYHVLVIQKIKYNENQKTQIDRFKLERQTDYFFSKCPLMASIKEAQMKILCILHNPCQMPCGPQELQDPQCSRNQLDTATIYFSKQI